MCNTATQAPDERPTGSHHGLPPSSRRPQPRTTSGHPDREADPDGLTPAPTHTTSGHPT